MSKRIFERRTSVIPAGPDPKRLRVLGAAAARISSVKLTPATALPVRSRPIEVDGFACMRREQDAPACASSVSPHFVRSAKA